MTEIHKLLYFATCLRRAGSLKKPYCWTDCVGVVKGDIIGYTKGGATAIVKFIFMINSCRANNLAKTTQQCLWCSWSQSLMVLSMGHQTGRGQRMLGILTSDEPWYTHRRGRMKKCLEVCFWKFVHCSKLLYSRRHPAVSKNMHYALLILLGMPCFRV